MLDGFSWSSIVEEMVLGQDYPSLGKIKVEKMKLRNTLKFVNQLYIYINLFFFGFFLHIGHYRVGESNGNPLQYSCLENPMDRGAW